MREKEHEVMFSVITVCLNAENQISKTIESVLNQDYYDYEYILIDGNSTDQTNNIIRSYELQFMEKKIRYRYFFGNDNGIYDAMNKGIFSSNGKWISFLNAGDIYYSSDILKKISIEAQSGEPAYIYGGSINRFKGSTYFRPGQKPSDLYFRMPFIHQSSFIDSHIARKYTFDTQYLFSADFNQFVELYLNGYKIKKVDYVVSEYSLEGTSQDNIISVVKEHERIRRKNKIAHHKIFSRYFRYIGTICIRKNDIIYSLYIKKHRNKAE